MTDASSPSDQHPYDALTPDVVLNAVDAAGYRTDGRLLALNSYENRVYQVGVEDGQALMECIPALHPPGVAARSPSAANGWVVAKFYRPGRWSDEAIREEHIFSQTLAEAEIPAVAPLTDTHGETLFTYATRDVSFRFSLYPRRGGRWPDLEDPDNLVWMGRFMGRIHAIGATKVFEHRPTLDIASFGHASVDYLREAAVIPDYLREAYFSLTKDVLVQVEAGFERAGDYAKIRLHGDCHPGNILWTDDGPHFVDFDDARMGPAVQDLWMLLSGERPQMTLQLDEILSGYTEFMDFHPRELHLIEPLRTLRMIHYSAWLARRWDDPSFPRNFPWFGEPRYWEEQILALREQAAVMNEPPLQWM